MIGSKFGRKYKLTVSMQDDEDSIVIENPFTCQFNIHRNTSSNLNDGTFLIYNLAEKTRNRVFQDAFDTGKYNRVSFDAGYGDQLFNCFTGNLFYSKSTRAGADIITEIHARDGGFDTANAMTHRTMAAGTSMTDLAKAMTFDFPNLKVGAIGNLNDVFKRPVAVSGNTYKEMFKYFGKDLYIDNERVNILLQNEVLDTGEVPIFNAATGLLETPTRENARLNAKVIFSPQVLMGQLVEIDASVMKNYNGQYKVIGVTHSGTISDAVGGDCFSRFELLVDGQLFGRFLNVKESANVKP